jgi:hypothetical protein
MGAKVLNFLEKKGFNATITFIDFKKSKLFLEK